MEEGSQNSVNIQNDKDTSPILKEDLTDKCSNFIQLTANVLFQHFSPIGKNINLKGYEALIFFLIIVILPLLTFAMMMYYFLYAGCLPVSLTFSGVSAQESVTEDILNSPTYHLCATGGLTSAGTGCCNLNGVTYQNSKSICSIFNSENTHCNYQQSPDCYSDQVANYDLILASVMQCSSPSTAVTNSIQYALYVSVVLSILFLVFKMMLSKGIKKVASPDDWKEFMKEESNP